MSYQRPKIKLLEKRINEPRKFIQVVMGPRQVGKTTLVTQLLKNTKIPHYFISAKVAQTTGQKAVYTKHKAFSQQQYFDWIIQGIKDHGSLSRTDIDALLWNRLSDLYASDTKKKAKINNIITAMRMKGIIKNDGNDFNSKWVLIQ